MSMMQRAASASGTTRGLSGRWAWAAALCGLLAAQPLAAVTFPNLYTIVVEPDPQAADRNEAAMRTAMAELLTRVTGRRQAAFDTELAHLIENASEYVNSIGELDRERIQVGFFAGRVEEELRALNWPVWGAERPLTLVWLAVDRGDGERAILPATGTDPGWSPAMSELMEELLAELEAVADERGLPVTLPLMDLQDLDAISFAEVWGGFDAQIAAASARYGPDAILVGRLEITDFGRRSQWTLLRDGSRQVTLGASVRDGLDWLADRFAGEFGVVGGARNARIEIHDIATLADYGRVVSYLETLSVLSAVDVASLDGDTLEVRVTTRGDRDVLRRVLTLGEVLVPADDLPRNGIAISGLDSILRFRLARSGP